MDLDKTKFTKDVIVPFTGQVFTIRRVRLKDFMAEVGLLSLSTSVSVQEALAEYQEKSKLDSKVDDKTTHFYVAKGVVKPKVWFGEYEQCPEDQIYYQDLGSDLDSLAQQITEYSFGVQTQAMEHFFLQQNGAGAIGLNGTEVRTEAVEPIA